MVSGQGEGADVWDAGMTMLLSDFPDHATFREKGAKLACADKLGVFALFDPM